MKVELVDVMGDDLAIVQAARVSTGSGSKGYEADRKLIHYLMKNRHTSPFEHVEFKFYVKAPIFVARQWVRHRTANWNEVSGRYKELDMEFFYPYSWRAQDTKNKQGLLESGDIDRGYCSGILKDIVDRCEEAYHDLLKQGVAREQARIVLPLNVYTEWYWKIDLYNLFHFLKLRCDSHAQYEIQQCALQIFDLIEPHVPIACEAWKQYAGGIRANK